MRCLLFDRELLPSRGNNGNCRSANGALSLRFLVTHDGGPGLGPKGPRPSLLVSDVMGSYSRTEITREMCANSLMIVICITYLAHESRAKRRSRIRVLAVKVYESYWICCVSVASSSEGAVWREGRSASVAFSSSLRENTGGRDLTHHWRIAVKPRIHHSGRCFHDGGLRGSGTISRKRSGFAMVQRLLPSCGAWLRRTAEGGRLHIRT